MENFEKVAGDWVFFRAVAKFSAILLALLAGFLKGVLEKSEWGGFLYIGDAITACLWDIIPVSWIMFKCWSNVIGLLYMW